jgi:cyclohexanone monooxygenase
MFCKRPCFSDDYLPTFNRPNVTLVDTEGRGVDRFTKTGVMVGEVEYEVDCAIFATGFEVGRQYTRRTGFDIVGRDGLLLSERWATGLSTFHGFHSHGFPNLFFLGITQTGLTVNFPHMLNEQTSHVAYIVQHLVDCQARFVEATPEAEKAWVATIGELGALVRNFLLECTPGYYNQEGKLADSNSLFSGQYGAGSEAFFALLRQWRQDGKFEGLRIG